MKARNRHFNNKFHIGLLICLLCLLLVPCRIYGAEAAGKERDTQLDPYRILCISSYNYSYPIVPDQLQGLSKGLEDFPVEIDYEFMDAKNFYSSGDISFFRNYLSYRMARQKRFDLIILCDDTAMQFGAKYHDTLFATIPMAFMGVNNITDAEVAAALENVTGIAETLDYKANFALMKKLFPERTKLYLVMDNTNSAQGEFLEFEKYIEYLPKDQQPDYRVLNTANYSRKGLERELGDIDPETGIILYLDCLEDGEGNHYTLKSGTKLIVDHAKGIPIWRISLANLEQGVLGGISYSYYDAGLNMAQIAKEILTGTDPDEIPLTREAVTRPYFDQNTMDKFNIKPSDLPGDTVILNARRTFASFYKENTLTMNLIFLVLILLCVVIAFLIYANHQRTKIIYQDFLTKMPNRFFISKKISLIDNDAAFGIIMMDADHFKTINDTKGHQVGDEILVGIASRLKAFPPNEVIFARIGGDEFMGLIYNADKVIADRICKELVKCMKKDIPTSVGDIHITISVGCAVYPDDVFRHDLVQSYADAALYEVKKRGRDGYLLFQPEYKKNIGKSS